MDTIIRQLADARQFSDGAWGYHATVKLANGSSHNVSITGDEPNLVLTDLSNHGATFPITDVIKVVYSDVNGH